MLLTRLYEIQIDEKDLLEILEIYIIQNFLQDDDRKRLKD
jgi:hypothetical protein